MGIYQSVCFKVEDVFVKFLTKKQDPKQIAQMVSRYRLKLVQEKDMRKKKAQQNAVELKKQRELIQMEAKQNAFQLEKQRELQLLQEKDRVLSILSKVVDVNGLDYTNYEFQAVQSNKEFFQNLVTKVFEKDEQGLTFISCEFDKSSKTEIKGYLIVTNKRVWFVDKTLEFQQKFRFQTIKSVKWSRDGLLEKELIIQYGVKKIEFDEIFDSKQMLRVGNLIVQKIS